ncbi:MAG: 2-oxo acid dehydrogenase subunit E2, partial [Candidatus Nanosalina sp.]
FIMKAAVEALEEYPKLNAELDTEKDEVVEKKYYDFNIAVDTDLGLLVPRIKNVDGKSIVELAEDVSEKAEKAKNGELSGKEMENGSFSITNLGVIGGEEFTPIINYPQTAILGVGRIGETAEVVDGEVVPRTTVKLSLSYDHRVVDGATAARFMNEVIENLENPEKMLLEL